MSAVFRTPKAPEVLVTSTISVILEIFATLKALETPEAQLAFATSVTSETHPIS